MDPERKIDYENVLNPAQMEAVMTLEGPVLVIAGAGSGKTRTLIYRVARLVETGIPPESVLLLTFTRKAAREMLERAGNLSDPRCRFVAGGTFHSLALRVLRVHADRVGFSSGFTILDRSDMEEIIRSLVPELNLPKGAPRFPKRATLANILSKAANLQQEIPLFMAEEYGQFTEFIPQITRLARRYAGYKVDHGLMDYDDLILNFRKLLSENTDVREQLSRQYRYVMVDEYQDTNTIQADIVRWLAHEHRNIMVVGDDCQSIYSFRGANYRNMFDFPSRFPGTRIIKLEENYRSTQPILSLTNSIMEPSGKKYTKCLFTRRKGGALPRVVNTRTEPEQAMFVCRHIRDQVNAGRPVTDFAVLFRAGYHSFELEAELTRQGFRYVKYGGFKFLESAHIKDFLAHLRIVVNRDEAVSWTRVLRLIDHVGVAKSQSIIRWMRTEGIPPERVSEWPRAGKRETGLKALSRLLARVSDPEMKPDAAVEAVMTYYLPVLKARFDDYPKRQKDLEQLAPMASRYGKLKGFLDDLVLEPPASSADMEEGRPAESLTLSTVHSAKGLEWPVVFIIWVMEGRFPASRSYGNPETLEEERRLMYVAATRARDELIICYPGDESVPPWQMADAGYRNGLSSFIRDVPRERVSFESTGTVRSFSRPATGRRGHGGRAVSSAPPPGPRPGGLSQGDRVTHPAFGPGVISRFVGDTKVEVLFKKAGRKLLHLEYTRLEKF